MHTYVSVLHSSPLCDTSNRPLVCFSCVPMRTSHIFIYIVSFPLLHPFLSLSAHWHWQPHAFSPKSRQASWQTSAQSRTCPAICHEVISQEEIYPLCSRHAGGQLLSLNVLELCPKIEDFLKYKNCETHFLKFAQNKPLLVQILKS